MDTVIATAECVRITSYGERTPIRIEVRRPRPDRKWGWVCTFVLHGIDDEVRRADGEDSWKALCVCHGVVQAYFASMLNQGDRFVRVDDESADFPVEAYFGV
ncbi:MAG: hypothetical protein WD066_02780 [Planctomycetaceae bacterium]